MFRSAMLLLLQFALCSIANAQISLLQIGDRDCVAPCDAVVAVIFVHGLTGSEATWVNSVSNVSFPKLLAEDPALKEKIDVYTLNYDSLWNSGQGIVQVTKAVAGKIDPLILKKGYSKIVFVAHSLGGNIAGKYLVSVNLNYGHAALSRFRSVITLGTPFEGASLAGIANMFSGNQQIRSLLDIRKNDFLQMLVDSRENYVKKRTNHHCASLEFDAGYETLPVVMGMSLVVSEDSAQAGATRSKPFTKHHLSLPKPADRDDEVYKWVSEEIGFCVAGQERCKRASDPGQTCLVGDFMLPRR